jgi:TM2 domain-containing membrane protein YozV
MTRDLRRYARQTNARLFVGFLVILFFLGDGLIYWLYGREAAIFGLLCLMAGLFPMGFIWGLLAFLGWLARKANQDEEE